MRRRVVLVLAATALTLLLASGVALAVGIGSAAAQSSVVGPGESIQKAVNAAEPGDTIVVRGVHREDVVIRKNGIKLRGDDATLKPPARADSPCSKASGPEAICVLGDVDLEAGELTGSRVRDVSVSGFTVRGFDEAAIEAIGASNATITGNRAVGIGDTGIGTFLSVGTKILANVTRGPGETGIGLAEAANTKVLGNNISGNVPNGQNPFSGGVAVFGNGEGIAPRNNTVVANNFGRNEPDIRWDGTGSGNVFGPNNCNKSVPARLCD